MEKRLHRLQNMTGQQGRDRSRGKRRGWLVWVGIVVAIAVISYSSWFRPTDSRKGTGTVLQTDTDSKERCTTSCGLTESGDSMVMPEGLCLTDSCFTLRVWRQQGDARGPLLDRQ